MFARALPRTALLHDAGPLALFAALFAAVVAGAVVLVRRSDAGRLCASLAVLPLFVAGSLWLAGVRIFDVRNLIGIGPFAAVSVAALLARLRGPLAGAAAAFCVLLLVVAHVRGDRVPPVPYDRVAQALVAEGWRSTDPIVVYGNVYAFEGPLEWCLPGQPRLRLLDRAGERTGRTFVVGVGVRTERRLVVGATAIRYVRGVLVARMDSTPPADTHVLLARS